jgi:hypothetical protein
LDSSASGCSFSSGFICQRVTGAGRRQIYSSGSLDLGIIGSCMEDFKQVLILLIKYFQNTIEMVE